MKKAAVIFFALVCSFVITELTVSLLFNFPTLGLTGKVMGVTTLDNRGEVYKPYSKYINNENGYKVFRRNNAGFPGTGIEISNSSKYILVLGNSFVEGYQVDPDSISTSVLQRQCRKIGENYQVVNLGASGHDAFDLWFRANYFERAYPPGAVILVITEYELTNHPGKLNFDLPPHFGEFNRSAGMRITTFFRNSSSFVNLVATAVKYTQRKDNTNEDLPPGNQNTGEKTYISIDTSAGLGACLVEFNKRYGGKFIAVSIMQDSIINGKISDFCKLHMVNFYSSPLLVPQYEIKGGGHLNTEGNSKLGELLYESFIGSISK